MIQDVSFSADGELLSLALNDGISVFAVNPVELRERYEHKQKIGSLAWIPETTCSVFSGVASQRSFSEKSVCVYDWDKKRAVVDIECEEAIHRIFAFPGMFVLVFRADVKFYRLSPPAMVLDLRCAVNEHAPCDCCSRDGAVQVAMSSSQIGEVRLVLVKDRVQKETTLKVANHPVSVMKFNRDGTLAAVVSERGTLIRLVNVDSGAVVSELRRGSFPASVFSVAFSPMSEYVAVLSSKGTVHVFEIHLDGSKEGEQRATIKWKKDGQGRAVLFFSTDAQLGVVQLERREIDILNVIGGEKRMELAATINV